MDCLNKLAEFLLYAIVLDFSLELLDFIHRLYESEESIHILSEMISSRLFVSLIVTQIILGTIFPLTLLTSARFGRVPDEMKRMLREQLAEQGPEVVTDLFEGDCEPLAGLGIQPIDKLFELTV